MDNNNNNNSSKFYVRRKAYAIAHASLCKQIKSFRNRIARTQDTEMKAFYTEQINDLRNLAIEVSALRHDPYEVGAYGALTTHKAEV
jgi:hypothetical protein